MRRMTTLVLATLFVAAPLAAQTAQNGERKLLSPPATAEGTIAGNTIVIHYSAPSMRGRKIMGGLVPFEKIWRTGANAATTLITQADLRIGDLEVPRGTYTIYTIPREDEWTLIINRQTGQWGTQYDEAQDLGRTPMKVSAIDPAVELFRMEIEPVAGKRGVLKLIWETTEVSVPIVVLD
ncbi:MAG: DUF2911 domain-containing protein [Thermoanaerobaculia bacterium]